MENDRLLSAAEAERLLGIRANTVSVWRHRGIIFPMGLDRSRRPLYRESDLLAARDRKLTRDQHEHRKRQRKPDK